MRNLTSFSRRSVLVMPLALAACYKSIQVIEIAGFTMGTSYKVIAVDHDNRVDEGEAKRAVSDALLAVNKSMSNWDDTSEISRLNAAPGGSVTQMSPALAEVMNAAATVHSASGGRFDTTLGPVIELWGFGAPGEQSVPTEDAVAAARLRSGHANTLTIDGDRVERAFDDTQVYLSGIGKGYGADAVGRAIEGLGITDYMVEIGGDVYASGRNPDGLPWQIGIESPDPLSASYMDVVGISGRGLASSGDYRNYIEVDGRRLSHMIDPETGRPVDHNTASATVIAENAMLADAWSTAMLVLGRERGLETAKTHGIAVQFVERKGSGSNINWVRSESDAFKSLTA